MGEALIRDAGRDGRSCFRPEDVPDPVCAGETEGLPGRERVLCDQGQPLLNLAAAGDVRVLQGLERSLRGRLRHLPTVKAGAEVLDDDVRHYGFRT